MDEPPSNLISPIPAATLVIFRAGRDRPEPELLMVERSKQMAFAGGAAVFPGGRVDPADYALARKLGADDEDEIAHRIAAVRETLEETGLAVGLNGRIDANLAAEARALLLDRGAIEPVLERYRLSLDLGALVPFARWLPEGLPHSRIFDTRFYLTDLGTGAVDITVDATENTHLFWASARQALQLADEGRLSLIFPTRRNLERLAQFGSFAEAKAHAETTPIRTITPRVDLEGGRTSLTIPDDLGYPVTSESFESATRG